MHIPDSPHFRSFLLLSPQERTALLTKVREERSMSAHIQNRTKKERAALEAKEEARKEREKEARIAKAARLLGALPEHDFIATLQALETKG